jgi:hypothetical protein
MHLADRNVRRDLLIEIAVPGADAGTVTQRVLADARVMTELRAHPRAQLVTLAYGTGLVHPRHPGGAALGAAATSFAVA